MSPLGENAVNAVMGFFGVVLLILTAEPPQTEPNKAAQPVKPPEAQTPAAEDRRAQEALLQHLHGIELPPPPQPVARSQPAVKKSTGGQTSTVKPLAPQADQEIDQDKASATTRKVLTPNATPQTAEPSQTIPLTASRRVPLKAKEVPPVAQSAARPTGSEAKVPASATPIETIPRRLNTGRVGKAEPVQQAGHRAEADGRRLLRLMEHGAGPDIQIAWPAERAARARLYDLLVRCYGVVSGFHLGEGKIITQKSGLTNSDGYLNLDLYSGFVRVIEGESPAAERQVLATLAPRARSAASATPVRIFPRAADALVLGSLQQLAKVNLAKAGSVRARYQYRHGDFVLHDLVLDGQPVPGAIAVQVPRACR